ncbi:MAG: ATP-dependent protease [Gammaproteobacteria bacterium]|nr:ATP-dependent protease [Gammaproteobacteria bacterium]
MGLAILFSRAQIGVQAPVVTVETHITGGVPRFNIVGLPEAAVRESKERVRSAIMNSRFEFPARRITINLAPAEMPKEGGRYDLAIALGILIASEQLQKHDYSAYEFAGELALSGVLRPTTGLVPFAIHCQKAGKTLIVPVENAADVACVRHLQAHSAQHLLDVCAHFSKKSTPLPKIIASTARTEEHKHSFDLSDVKGQTQARRALEIAAAGEHSLLMVGPPGTGKTMLAHRLASILPPMTEDETLDVAAVYSLQGHTTLNKHWFCRPFRAPHHTASSVALVGGGSPPKPGEISLAHQGVLFLDELPEFQRRVLESLREPLESGIVVISRAAQQAEFPSRFQLIAAMNPCPCGHYGNPLGQCHCSAEQIQRYHQRLSGPFLDRIDMRITVAQLPPQILLNSLEVVENSRTVQERVVIARHKQHERQQQSNARLTHQDLVLYCHLTPALQHYAVSIVEERRLSARSYHRILKLARTIADLDKCEAIEEAHLAEAFAYQTALRTVEL